MDKQERKDRNRHIATFAYSEAGKALQNELSSIIEQARTELEGADAHDAVYILRLQQRIAIAKEFSATLKHAVADFERDYRKDVVG